MNYILASASPRRRELLKQAGMEFTVVPAEVSEEIEADSPEEVVMELSRRKAEDVFGRHGAKDCVVIAADTIVSYRGEILGKPRDEAEALDMLSMLADRTHQVYTGITLMYLEEEIVKQRTFFVRTEVSFYPVSRDELLDYIRTGDSLDKAGGYGIQGRFAVHVREIHGDYNNVVGLPIGRLYQELKKIRRI